MISVLAEAGKSTNNVMEKINLNNSPHMNQITKDEENSKTTPPDEQIQELE